MNKICVSTLFKTKIRLQRYYFFLIYANFSARNLSKLHKIVKNAFSKLHKNELFRISGGDEDKLKRIGTTFFLNMQTKRQNLQKNLIKLSYFANFYYLNRLILQIISLSAYSLSEYGWAHCTRFKK